MRRARSVLALAGLLGLAGREVHAQPARGPEASAVSVGPAVGAWFLVGGVNEPTLLQPLGDGRALVCGLSRCDVWDQATGTWTRTTAVVLPQNTLAHLRRGDGTVVAIDGARQVASAIWSPATGRWTSAAALPEPLGDLVIGTLTDGRVVATGHSWSLRRPQAYVADAELAHWSALIDAPADVPSPSLVPTPSGVTMLAGGRAWRHTVGTAGWRPVAPPNAATVEPGWMVAWGDDLLVSEGLAPVKRIDLLDAADRAHEVPRPMIASGSIGVSPIATANGVGMKWLHVEHGTFLWRRPDEVPVPAAENGLDEPYVTVALDDAHLLGIAPSGALIVFALDGRPPPGRPCDGLARHLTSTPPEHSAGRELALTSPACRAQVASGQAPALLALVRGWADQPERRQIGRAFQCVLHDPQAVDALPRWFAAKDATARLTCYQAAAAWPAAEAAYTTALARGVREADGRWSLDGVLVASANTPAIRDRLAPLLRPAVDHRAFGFQALRDKICGAEPGMSAERERACADTASAKESVWRPEQEREDARRRSQPPSRVPRVVVATALFGGAIATTYATRNQDTGRGLATASGAIGGATLGLTLAALATIKADWLSKDGHEIPAALVGGAIIGGVLGGLALHAAATSPNSRAPLTGVGLAVPYLLAVALPFD